MWRIDDFDLPQRHSLASGIDMVVERLQDAHPQSLEQIKKLLKNAYTDRSMDGGFEQNLRNRSPLVLFTLWSDGTIIGTRCIGPVEWDMEIQEANARSLGQERPIIGCSFTLRKDKRGAGLGRLFWENSMNWIKTHGCINVLLGDTISRQAFAMYARHGAWFHMPDVNRLYGFYGVADLGGLLAKTAGLEYFPKELESLYAWPFTKDTEKILGALGYARLI